MRNRLNTIKGILFNVGALPAVAALTCGCGINLSSASAQTDDPVATIVEASPSAPIAKKRATEEPVFRVSKLNRDKSPTIRERGIAVAEALTTPAQPAAIVAGVTAKAAEATPLRTGESAIDPALSTVATPTASPTASLSANRSPTAINATTASSTSRMTATVPHPLDRAIEMAKNGLANIQANVQDYSAIMVKRERIDGVLKCPEYLQMKVRCPRTISGQKVPFSVYLKALKPKKTAGREVVWVEGENSNKLCAHETGLLGMKRFYLDPTGWVAMKDNRYPIFDAGIENLIIKLIEKAEAAKAANQCTVNYRDNAEIMKRKCSLIELINEERHESDEFHKAHVFIDNELNLPVRYVAFDWPSTPGGKPEIIEEYTYVRINLNQGYKDIDFSPDNPAYKFPSR